MSDQPTGPVVVTANRVSFAYDGPTVVHDVDFALTPGERVALVGTNGSGKSTLAKLLVGLLRPRDGEVLLGGSAPADLAPVDLAARAGYVFQDPEQQFARLRVDEEVMLGLDEPGRRRAGGAHGPHRPPARARSVRAARTRCRAVSSGGCRWHRRSSATRRSSCSTSRRTGRTDAATRHCSRSWPRTSATGPPCWPRPTTSGSSRTSPAGSSGSKAGAIVHVELAEGGLTTAEIVA